MTDADEETPTFTHRFHRAVDWKVYELMTAARERSDAYDPVAYAATIRRQFDAATPEEKQALIAEYETALAAHKRAQAEEQGPYKRRIKSNALPEKTGRQRIH